MDINEMITVISNVGFPIAVCCFMFYYMNRQTEKHKEEIDKLSETLQNNTKVLTELTTLIKTIVK